MRHRDRGACLPRSQRRGQRFAAGGANVRVGHDDERRRGAASDRVGEPIGFVDAHVDGVTALAQRDQKRVPPHQGDDFVGHGRRLHCVGAHREVALGVGGRPEREELPRARVWIGTDGKIRPVGHVRGALGHRLGRGGERDDERPVDRESPDPRRGHRTSADGDDFGRRVSEKLFDQCRLARAERLFPFAPPQVRDSLPRGALDLGVGIHEGNAQSARDLRPGGAFAGAHEAAQHDRAHR